MLQLTKYHTLRLRHANSQYLILDLDEEFDIVEPKVNSNKTQFKISYGKKVHK